MPSSTAGSSDDWVVAGIDRIAQAGREVRARLDAALAELERARQVWMQTDSLAGFVQDALSAGMRDTRLRAEEAFHAYERAALALRVQVSRFLVEEEGLSLTEVANRLHVSRQAATRLYRRSGADRAGSPG